MRLFFRQKHILSILGVSIFLFTVILAIPIGGKASRWVGEFTPSAYTFMSLILKADGITPSPPTPSPTFTPSPTSTNPPASSPLDYVNVYRQMAGLPLVSENPDWNAGNWFHSRYMVKNDVIEHDEDPGNIWYTPEGRAAAQSSNLAVSSSTTYSDQAAINAWMVAPFHGIGILDPALSIIGYGSYREADGGWQTGAGLDVIRGLGPIPPEVTFPIMWPGNGQIVSLTTFPGYEFPDPLTSCPGYSAPAGLPIYLQIGEGAEIPSVTDSSFSQGATSLEHCIFDETNYINSNPSYQSLARTILNNRDAIILIPRAPLATGAAYTVSITTNEETYTWAFITASVTGPILETNWIVK